jgi:membrane-bound metal-dependent hydrolase YbcI (DUF457 family)
MVPLSHVLTGYLVGRFIRARRPSTQQNVPSWKDPIILVALAGSVAPDLDVIPGLLGVWPGTAFHREATHSILGSFFVAGCVAGLAYAVFRRSEQFKLLYVAALVGVWTHIGWDVLNTWGVILFWPHPEPTQGQLVHTGDFFVQVGLLVCVICSLALGNRVALILSLAWQQQIASDVLAQTGGGVNIFPTRIPSCRWLVLSRDDKELHADCASVPFTTQLNRVKSVPVMDTPLAKASLKADMANDFRNAVWYPFADVRQLDSGETMVVWRDLREAFMDDDVDTSPGVYVRLNADGEVLETVHKWRLPFW